MGRFDYFVVFAEMRTGSNFLEANINAFDGLTCHGEAFNPSFAGHPNRDEVLGMSREERDADPLSLLSLIKEADGLNGFRYFSSHDARVLDTILNDPRCAKILLTRNPLDTFVSLEIARETKQWKLTNTKRRRTTKITFDMVTYETYLADTQAFQSRLFAHLKGLAQTASFIRYEDLQNIDAVNGLAEFLGSEDRLDQLDQSIKKQNPGTLADKVENYDEMLEALKIDGTDYSELKKDFTPESMYKWMRENPGHRFFTVVRHPVVRAHAAFCDKILSTGKGSYLEIRKTLIESYGLVLPDKTPCDTFDIAAHKAAFMAFLRFVELNLAGQTSIRIDPHWASQSNTIQGFAQFRARNLYERDYVAFGFGPYV